MVMIDLRKPPVLVLATNPWLNPHMVKVAKEAGVNVKKFWYFRNPPPWSRFREYKAGASEKQLEIWEAFRVAAKRSAEEVAGLPKYERLRRRIELMRAYLSKREKVLPATARARI